MYCGVLTIGFLWCSLPWACKERQQRYLLQEDLEGSWCALMTFLDIASVLSPTAPLRVRVFWALRTFSSRSISTRACVFTVISLPKDKHFWGSVSLESEHALMCCWLRALSFLFKPHGFHEQPGRLPHWHTSNTSMEVDHDGKMTAMYTSDCQLIYCDCLSAARGMVLIEA